MYSAAMSNNVIKMSAAGCGKSYGNRQQRRAANSMGNLGVDLRVEPGLNYGQEQLQELANSIVEKSISERVRTGVVVQNLRGRLFGLQEVYWMSTSDGIDRTSIWITADKDKQQKAWDAVTAGGGQTTKLNCELMGAW